MEMSGAEGDSSGGCAGSGGSKVAVTARVRVDIVVGAESGIIQNVILPNTQSINGLLRVSQLCPRTTEQLGSKWETKKVIV